MTDQPPIRVLLADDQALVRGALAALLDLEPDMAVVAQVERGDEVVAAALEHRIEVALLDIDMPGLDGIETAAALRRDCPDVGVLIVTTFGRPGYVRRAMEAGAIGFMVKDAPAAELAEAVRRVRRGERVIDPTLATESLIDGASPLTEREADALRLVMRGHATTEIAAALHLSKGTVRNYLSNAASKTGAASSTQAAILASERGWL